MTIETLHFQHYFYQKYLQSTSTTKRVTYWVRLDQDIERHRLMYARRCSTTSAAVEGDIQAL